LPAGDFDIQSSEEQRIGGKGIRPLPIRSYEYGRWDASVIINIKHCTRASLTDGEIAAVILHELGHLLNEPELQDEPTFNFCYMHGIQFNENEAITRVTQYATIAEVKHRPNVRQRIGTNRSPLFPSVFYPPIEPDPDVKLPPTGRTTANPPHLAAYILHFISKILHIIKFTVHVF
jgi:hypothetical protein